MSAALDRILDELFDRPAERGVSLACVVRARGEIVAERHGVRPADDFRPELVVTPETPLTSWSMAKSITHAALGVLVLDDAIDLAAPAAVPEWTGTDAAAITPLDLLEMRSGLSFVEDYVDGSISNCIEMLFGGTDPSFAAYAARQPLVHPVGEVFNYSSGTSNILARLIGDAVAGGRTGEERAAAVAEFLRRRLFEPTGMADATPHFDDAGDFVGSSYVDATARDFARFGELYAFDGVTDRGRGDRILPVGWLDHARAPISFDPDGGFGYGRHWWTWPTFPGSLACHGYDGQYVLVLPDDDVVVCHLGATDVAHQRAVTMSIARLAERAR
ncbi:MAG: serine hydrolase domain-containing protein [Actinomycetota bacterium]